MFFRSLILNARKSFHSIHNRTPKVCFNGFNLVYGSFIFASNVYSIKNVSLDVLEENKKTVIAILVTKTLLHSFFWRVSLTFQFLRLLVACKNSKPVTQIAFGDVFPATRLASGNKELGQKLNTYSPVYALEWKVMDNENTTLKNGSYHRINIFTVEKPR